jgi:diketogulonate reductase-like aldo/keto reductase
LKKKELFLGAYNLTNFEVLNQWLTTDIDIYNKGIDLAPSYGNSVEIMDFIGKYESHYRHQLQTSYKIDIEFYTINRSKWFMNFLDLLKRSKLERMDYIFIHWPWNYNLNETLDFLLWLKSKSYVKNIGIANFSCLDKEIKNSIIETIDVIQEECHILIPEIETSKIKKIGYSPGANGKLYTSELYKELIEKFKSENIIGQLNKKWLFENLDGIVFGTNKIERMFSWIKYEEYLNNDDYEVFKNIIKRNKNKIRCFSPSLSLPV